MQKGNFGKLCDWSSGKNLMQKRRLLCLATVISCLNLLFVDYVNFGITSPYNNDSIHLSKEYNWSTFLLHENISSLISSVKL